MRLLYILNGYPNYSEVFIQNEVERLMSEGHALSVLDISSSKSKVVNGVKVHSNTTSLYKIILAWLRSPRIVSKGFMNPLSFISRKQIGIKSVLLFLSIPYLRKKINDISPDQIITHFLFTTSHAAASLASSLGIPYHIRLHTSYSTLPDGCRNTVLLNADRVSAISMKLVRYYSEMIDHQRSIELIRQDIDLNKLGKRETSGYTVINHFIAIGRLVPKKGFVELLQGLAFYRNNFNDSFSLNIYGTGPLQKQLEKLVSDLGLENNVFVLGSMDHADLMTKLSKASVLFVPSIDNGQDVDGIPSVMIESMMLKTLVIGTQVGGMPEILKDKETGYVFSSVEPETIAKTLDKALKSQKDWEVIKNNAIQLVHKEYSKKLEFN